MKEKDKHLMLFYKSNNYEWLWLIIPAGVESSVVFLLIFFFEGKFFLQAGGIKFSRMAAVYSITCARNVPLCNRQS